MGETDRAYLGQDFHCQEKSCTSCSGNSIRPTGKIRELLPGQPGPAAGSQWWTEHYHLLRWRECAPTATSLTTRVIHTFYPQIWNVAGSGSWKRPRKLLIEVSKCFSQIPSMDHREISWDHVSLFQRSPDSLPAVNSMGRPEMITSFDRIQQDPTGPIQMGQQHLELEVAISTIFATLSYQSLGFTHKNLGATETPAVMRRAWN